MLGEAGCRHGFSSDSNQVLPGAESMPQRMSQGHRIIGLATERNEADPRVWHTGPDRANPSAEIEDVFEGRV